MTTPNSPDPTDRVLGQAVLAFLVLAALEVMVGFASGAIALGLGGIHNFQESPALGLIRQARRREDHTERSFWDCHVGPLAPAINALGTLVIAIGLAALEFIHVFELRTDLVWLALALEAADFAANAFYGRRIESLHHHDPNHEVSDEDEKAHSAERHLKGDAGYALLAIAAYSAVLVSDRYTWADPLAAIGGILIIIYFNRRPIARSIRTWLAHVKEGHITPGSV